MERRRKPKLRRPVWESEPDLVDEIDPATGYRIVLNRNQMGAWCGYVIVPPGHPANGKGYNDAPVCDLDVHGCVTYAQKDSPGRPEASPPGHWWIGFDCAHCDDYMPWGWARRKEFGAITDLDDRRRAMRAFKVYTDRFGDELMPSGKYRTVKYAKSEALSLAKQLAAIAARSAPRSERAAGESPEAHPPSA